MQIRHDGVVSNSRFPGVLRAGLRLLGPILLLVAPGELVAQRVLSQPSRVITVARGGSALMQFTETLVRYSVADQEIADASLVSPREMMISGKTVGTTTVILWDRLERVEIIQVVVSPDIGSLQRQISLLFPDTPITLTASGSAIIVSGTVREAHVARRIMEVVSSSGATVINNMQEPPARQVLLHVRFAEVNRSVLSRLNADLRVTNPQNLGDAFDRSQLLSIETLAEGVVRLFLLGDDGSSLEAMIRALKTQGHFKSLAEPNLIAIEGREATFLAGGEFPFPSVQGGQSNAVTIAWKEFGIRLNFTPTITNAGSIRLNVMPEVSSLDFANGLTFGGFQIPALLTRRAETSVELRPGQHLAIAGLLDNSTVTEWQKIPLLGDLPIIGAFFRGRSVRDRNTELLVLVTPHIVEATDTPPPLPTGEPDTWDRTKFMKENGHLILPAGVRILPPR